MKLGIALFFTTAAAVAATYAQSPKPVIVQAMTPGQAAPSQPAPSAPVADSSASALKALQELKAQNAQILEKQTAALQQLEDMEKAAEQIKIYSKRG